MFHLNTGLTFQFSVQDGEKSARNSLLEDLIWIGLIIKFTENLEEATLLTEETGGSETVEWFRLNFLFFFN